MNQKNQETIKTGETKKSEVKSKKEKKPDSYPMINTRRQKVRMALLLIWVIILPITLFYFSPYIPFMGITQGIITGSVVVFCGQFLSALLFGRLFCGWLCPVGAVQEFASGANPKRLNRKKLQWVKFIIWIPWISAWIALALNSLGIRTTIPKIDMLFVTEYGISVARPEAYITYLFVLTIILVLSLIIGRRAFCHTVCWMSPFMIPGRKLGELLRIPSLTLKIESKKCTGCGQCGKVCPMSIDLPAIINNPKHDQGEIRGIRHHDCTYCMRCADICPKSVIRLTFTNKKRLGERNDREK